jgi:hypothetical protein
MPVSDHLLRKTCKKLQLKFRNILRSALSEICSFEEVMDSADKLGDRMKIFIEERVQINYSKGYHYTIDIL